MTLLQHIRRLRRDESGATLVEFALTIALLLLLFFALIDFGRLTYHWVAAEKATGIAARIASVRPPACPGVPQTYVRGSNTAARMGNNCSSATGTCSIPAVVTCTGAGSNATVTEIWARIEPLLPNTATRDNLTFRYTPDYDTSNGANNVVGFLGGPYVPTVTVELTGLQFQFVTPLAGLANMAMSSSGSTLGGTLAIPSMSVSMPGEDLALGTAG